MRRYALVSDIHANAWALEAVLADIDHRRVRAVFNLGDSLYGPLDPRRTFALLRDVPMRTIAGNQDRMLVEAARAGRSTQTTVSAVLQELDVDALAWLDTLPGSLVEEDILLCHGTPEKDSVYLLEDVASGTPQVRGEPELRRLLAGRQERVVCCGHSHLPRVVALRDGRLLCNPGSVGLPAYRQSEAPAHVMENHAPHAAYALLEEQAAGWRVEFVRVAYDWQAASACAADRGRDDWAYALATGRA